LRRRRLSKEHLKLTAGLLVLNVTTSEATKANMLKLAAKVSSGGNSHQLFQACPLFGKFSKSQGRQTNFPAGDWQRVGNGSFRFDRRWLIKATRPGNTYHKLPNLSRS
jgi:hypothetical protein